MKTSKILVLSVFLMASLSLSSCKKSYSCVCTTSNFDEEGNLIDSFEGSPETIEANSKSKATSICESYGYEDEMSPTTCLIK